MTKAISLCRRSLAGWLAAHSLEHYQKYGAKEDAIRMLFEDRALDGVFHSDYAMEELPEAAFLAWLQDPEGFIQSEAETYIKSDPENILLQFLENDALLAEYQALIQDTGSPIHRMKAITDALNGSNAKMVTVTVQKGEGELTFKMEASQMKGHHAYYSSYYIPAADRRRFQQVFGRSADFKAEDVIRITYGRNTIYLAEPAQAESTAKDGGEIE